MAHMHAWLLQIQFVKQPVIMVNLSREGLKTVVIRESNRARKNEDKSKAAMGPSCFSKSAKKSLQASTIS